MKETAEYDERRHHQRSPVSSSVIAVLMTSEPEVIGSVSDISLGGAKITYHNPKNKEINFTNLKVDFISDDRFVEAIPCSNAWEHPLTTSTYIASGDLRQCGIQFADLNPNQQFLLRGFINRCASREVSPEAPPDFFSGPDL